MAWIVEVSKNIHMNITELLRLHNLSIAAVDLVLRKTLTSWKTLFHGETIHNEGGRMNGCQAGRIEGEEVQTLGFGQFIRLSSMECTPKRHYAHVVTHSKRHLPHPLELLQEVTPQFIFLMSALIYSSRFPSSPPSTK